MKSKLLVMAALILSVLGYSMYHEHEREKAASIERQKEKAAFERARDMSEDTLVEMRVRNERPNGSRDIDYYLKIPARSMDIDILRMEWMAKETKFSPEVSAAWGDAANEMRRVYNIDINEDGEVSLKMAEREMRKAIESVETDLKQAARKWE